MNQFVRYFLLNLIFSAGLILVIISCGDDNDDPKQKLTITSIQPGTAKVGETITIIGTGFSTVPSQNVVIFTSNASAIIESATATELHVVVPDLAQTGKIRVTVDGTTVTSPEDFVVDTTVPDPVITSVVPAEGFRGTEIVINGSNFSSSPEDITVYFGDVTTSTISSSTVSEIVVTVPNNAPFGSVDLKVVRGEVASNVVTFVVKEPPVKLANVYFSSISKFGPVKLFKGESGEVTFETLYDDLALGVAVDSENKFIYYVSSNNKIYKGSIDGSTVATAEVIYSLPSTRFGYDLALDLEHGNIYFTDVVSATIVKGSLDGNAPLEDIYQLSNGTLPTNVKLLVADNAIYWTESTNKRVMKGDLEGTNAAVAVYENAAYTDLRGLAVDVASNSLFFIDVMLASGSSSQYISKMYKGSMDGTAAAIQIFSAGDYVSGTVNDMEVDSENGYVYWLNQTSDGELVRGKMDGTAPEVIFSNIIDGVFFDLEFVQE